MKKAKRTYNKKAAPALTFINLGKHAKGGEGVNIMRSGLYIGPVTKTKLLLAKGDHVIMALNGSVAYIAKKPRGVFGGHRVSINKQGDRAIVGMKPSKFGLKMGVYSLGRPVWTTLTSEQGKEIRFKVYPLIHQ